MPSVLGGPFFRGRRTRALFSFFPLEFPSDSGVVPRVSFFQSGRTRARRPAPVPYRDWPLVTPFFSSAPFYTELVKLRCMVSFFLPCTLLVISFLLVGLGQSPRSHPFLHPLFLWRHQSSHPLSLMNEASFFFFAACSSSRLLLFLCCVDPPPFLLVSFAGQPPCHSF